MHFIRNMSKRKNCNVIFMIIVVLFLLSYSETFIRVLVQMQTPLLVYGQKRDEDSLNPVLLWTLKAVFPILDYTNEETRTCLTLQDYETEQYILHMESQEDEQSLLSYEQIQQYEKANEAISDNSYAEQADNINELVETDSMNNSSELSPWDENEITDESYVTELDTGENNLKAQKKKTLLNMDQYKSTDRLLEDFYVVDKTTYIDPNEICIEKLEGQDMSVQKDTQDLPQILIYHTHAHEEYVCDTGNYTVMNAGEELATILQSEYGYQVMHDEGVYDDVRDYAYAKAAPALEQILEQNPSIEVIIDLHRDGVSNDVHLVTNLDDSPAAQIMLFNGLSRTNRIGEIDYLKNDNRSGNLAFSFQLEKALKEYYPGLSRKIYLKGYRYNMHYRQRSLLVELGAQTNTKEEVQKSLGPLAKCIDVVLSPKE